ncbi:U3 small nucleolar RNA-associated protein 23 [Pelomyxa schiedti]|nr:U3 small nucleolar RNA-associated protein 23 [Pelomyxa schiedti]
MKIKRFKRASKKALPFYLSTFKIEEPFFVLVEGEFLRVALFKRANIKVTIPRFLKGKTTFVITECTIQQMRKMGDDYAGALIESRTFERVQCHTPCIDASQCLYEMLKCNNASNHPDARKYWLCTVTPGLTDAIKPFLSVPVITFLDPKVDTGTFTLLPPPGAAVRLRDKRLPSKLLGMPVTTTQAGTHQITAAPGGLTKKTTGSSAKSTVRGGKPTTANQARPSFRSRAFNSTAFKQIKAKPIPKKKTPPKKGTKKVPTKKSPRTQPGEAAPKQPTTPTTPEQQPAPKEPTPEKEPEAKHKKTRRSKKKKPAPQTTTTTASTLPPTQQEAPQSPPAKKPRTERAQAADP